MTRSVLCVRVAPRSSLSKANVAAALGPLTSTIADALAEGETVTIAGFGKLAARTRAARQGRNSPHRRSPSTSPPPGCRRSRPQRPFATRSTHSEPSPVDSNDVRQSHIRGRQELGGNLAIRHSCEHMRTLARGSNHLAGESLKMAGCHFSTPTALRPGCNRNASCLLTADSSLSEPHTGSLCRQRGSPLKRRPDPTNASGRAPRHSLNLQLKPHNPHNGWHFT